MSKTLRAAGLATIVLVASSGCTIPTDRQRQPVTTSTVTSQPSTTAPTPTPGPAIDLAGIAGALAAIHPGAVSVALAIPDSSVVAGMDQVYPAWSTIKVPLAIAAQRDGVAAASDILAAIEESDNAAAERLWSALGTPAAAAAKVTQVLRDGGDTSSVVPDTRTTQFSIFGQTMWSAADQARFACRLPQLRDAEPVLDAMAHISASQTYGLGTLGSAHFKGGWGPDPAGLYTVRQFGYITTDAGVVGVSLVARPADGTYASGSQMLTDVSLKLQELLAASPSA